MITPGSAPKTASTPDIVSEETAGTANAVPITSRLTNVRRSAPTARSRSSVTPTLPSRQALHASRAPHRARPRVSRASRVSRTVLTLGSAPCRVPLSRRGRPHRIRRRGRSPGARGARVGHPDRVPGMGERARLPATVRRPPPQPRSLPGRDRGARRTDRRPPHGRAPPERARGVPPRAARRAHRLGDRPSSRTLAGAPRSGRPRDRADGVEPRGVRRKRGDRSRRGRAPRRVRPGAGRRRGAARAPAGARRLLHDRPLGPAQGAGGGRARVPRAPSRPTIPSPSS